jgi:hypothetical protein
MKLVIVICSLIILSCNSAKQGRIKQGKNGVIESGVIKPKCTPPQKSYAKEFDARVKAEMDSLRYASLSSFEAAFNQKVIKLREYSSKGLELDLVLFRICEMSNNRGFSNDQTADLISKAILLWNGENKANQTPSKIFSNNQTGGITVNDESVRSYNAQPGSITAHTVTIGDMAQDDFTIYPGDNYVFRIDTIQKRLIIRPKFSVWKNIFIGVPLDEMEVVRPSFWNKSARIVNSLFAPHTINNEKYYAIISGGIPATRDFFYFMTYEKMPSKITFGDYPHDLYTIKL